jgi:DNA-binding NtrC family response regulator
LSLLVRITLFKGNSAPYCALVTDINLAGRIDGWEVAKAVRETAPAFPVIYMTGAAAVNGPHTACRTACC